MEQQYPGKKHGIVNSFLEMLPLLKKKFKQEAISYCEKCGEPTSKEICNTCLLQKKLEST